MFTLPGYKNPTLLERLDTDCCLQTLNFDSDPTSSTIKILGLFWFAIEDNFFFQVQPNLRPCTKHNLLSAVARIFDPMGFLAKHLIRAMWCLGLFWNKNPSPELIRQWENYNS